MHLQRFPSKSKRLLESIKKYPMLYVVENIMAQKNTKHKIQLEKMYVLVLRGREALGVGCFRNLVSKIELFRLKTFIIPTQLIFVNISLENRVPMKEGTLWVGVQSSAKIE